MNRTYFSEYISINSEIKKNTDKGVYERWSCSLDGEYVGFIEHRSWEADHAKCYFAFAMQAYDERHRFLGGYSTLVAAKLDMHGPAADYLEEQRNAKPRINIASLPQTDFEFYPTPSGLAGRLFAGIDWTRIKSILEPSAGKGDLIECALRMQERMRHGFSRSRREFSIDCIELDPDLRALLVGKGYRVVHDDFLTYYTRKRYDLILMNPPFSNGDLHLLRALELCENGGQIACILNAETIRNPFTARRKMLASKLKRYGASIKIVKNAFAKADRAAEVDAALITVSIPALSDETIFENLKRANRQPELGAAPATELSPSDHIERLIREYDLFCSAGIELIRQYNGLSPHIRCSKTSDIPIIELIIAGSHCSTAYSSEDVNCFLKEARARFWRELFDIPELRERMTSTMQSTFIGTVESMKDYEFSRFNISQVLERIMSQLVTGVEDAIIKCFDKLSAEHTYNKDVQNDNIHYYNGWKTNKAHRVNIKCIIPTYGCFARSYKTDKYGRWKDTLEGIDAHGCFEVLDDLEKALDYLDKGETPRTNLSSVLQNAAATGVSRNIECKYFYVTFYKKGTCHIHFKNQRILDRLNIYVGRARSWLPPTYGRVRYENMDAESRRVVDEFQGREQYERVFAAPADYIVETRAEPLLIGA